MPVSSPSSRMRWSTPVGMRRMKQERVAATLLPEHATPTTTRSAISESNGRTLTNNAADACLAVLTNGKVDRGQGQGPTSIFLPEFPWGCRTIA